MDLKTYLFVMEITNKEFSAMVECHRDHLSKIINGHLRPGKWFAKDVERVTKGAVTRKDLMHRYQMTCDSKKSLKESLIA